MGSGRRRREAERPGVPRRWSRGGGDTGEIQGRHRGDTGETQRGLEARLNDGVEADGAGGRGAPAGCGLGGVPDELVAC